jgi:hypothetical protein
MTTITQCGVIGAGEDGTSWTASERLGVRRGRFWTVSHGAGPGRLERGRRGR